MTAASIRRRRACRRAVVPAGRVLTRNTLAGAPHASVSSARNPAVCHRYGFRFKPAVPIKQNGIVVGFRRQLRQRFRPEDILDQIASDMSAPMCFPHGDSFDFRRAAALAMDDNDSGQQLFLEGAVHAGVRIFQQRSGLLEKLLKRRLVHARRVNGVCLRCLELLFDVSNHRCTLEHSRASLPALYPHPVLL